MSRPSGTVGPAVLVLAEVESAAYGLERVHVAAERVLRRRAHGPAQQRQAAEHRDVLERHRGLTPGEHEGVGLAAPEGGELEQRALVAAHPARGGEDGVEDPNLTPQGLVARAELGDPPPPELGGFRRPALELDLEAVVEDGAEIAGRQGRESGRVGGARAGEEEVGQSDGGAGRVCATGEDSGGGLLYQRQRLLAVAGGHGVRRAGLGGRPMHPTKRELECGVWGAESGGECQSCFCLRRCLRLTLPCLRCTCAASESGGADGNGGERGWSARHGVTVVTTKKQKTLGWSRGLEVHEKRDVTS